MKRKPHDPEQIIRKLRIAEQVFNKGMSVADVCEVPPVLWTGRYGSRHDHQTVHR
ncbi:hypothetical protein [Synechococcus sp. CS-1332]|uniref:hypothetical protein n=1 Tax=Synechococcus sp. CS-1332 TaxID=2847972 RepID=UPI00223ACFD3|nr:hypothetical protein [Synechococcus sp. CS-1332]MCT0208592.1 hypothetical protein [Synechococcus sp. CS-1332]